MNSSKQVDARERRNRADSQWTINRRRPVIGDDQRMGLMMKHLNRRTVVTGAIAGTVTMGAGILRAAAAGDEATVDKLWTLEGELKVHPKFVYRYFVMLLNGQTCALYGADHSREPEQLSNLQLPARVRVRGKLGTDHHSGGTIGNPSPFPAGWWVYMDVHEAMLLK